MDDDTQKEKMIFFGGAEDIFCRKIQLFFNQKTLKTRSLQSRGSSLVASVRRGSIFDDSRLDPLCFRLRKSSHQQQLFRELNPKIIMLVQNQPSSTLENLLELFLNFLECFLPKILKKYKISSSNQACLLTLKHSLTLHHFFTQRFFFLLDFSLKIFSFLSLLSFKILSSNQTQ